MKWQKGIISEHAGRFKHRETETIKRSNHNGLVQTSSEVQSSKQTIICLLRD